MSLNAYQRLAQDSINFQMRMHTAEAERDTLQATVEQLEDELAALKAAAEPKPE